MKIIESKDAEILVPLLHDAEEGDDRIRAALNEPNNVAYIAVHDGVNIGAALMRWIQEESELIYIAMVPDSRGKGHGKAFVAALLEEAQQRQVKSVLVGTASAGIGQIAFYQKCGFRVDSVRKDFFDYFTEPIYENGILLRDMLVFRWSAES